jgi:uncharacterized protein (DUF2164 family)
MEEENLSLEFGDHLKKCGIVTQLTPPGTPQWNGVSERRNQTLLGMVRLMMSQDDLPLLFWGYALETAAFTLNRAPSKSVEKTPYEIWTGKHLGLSFLKVWGFEAYVRRLMSDKLTPKLDKCFFVGYPGETKGYYFYNKAEGQSVCRSQWCFLRKGVSIERIKWEQSEAYVKRLMSDKLTPKSDKCFFVGYPSETKGYYFYNKAEGKVCRSQWCFLRKGVSIKRIKWEKSAT